MKVKEIYKTDRIRWSMDEITYPEHSKESDALMALVVSNRVFDIGWVGLAKEIASFNIVRNHYKGNVKVAVCAEMDDLEDDTLICDADDDGSLTEQDIRNIWEDDMYSNMLGEVSSSVVHEREVGVHPSLKEISDALMQLWAEAKGELEEGFTIVKKVVADYKRKK